MGPGMHVPSPKHTDALQTLAWRQVCFVGACWYQLMSGHSRICFKVPVKKTILTSEICCYHVIGSDLKAINRWFKCWLKGYTVTRKFISGLLSCCNYSHENHSLRISVVIVNSLLLHLVLPADLLWVWHTGLFHTLFLIPAVLSWQHLFCSCFMGQTHKKSWIMALHVPN